MRLYALTFQRLDDQVIGVHRHRAHFARHEHVSQRTTDRFAVEVGRHIRAGRVLHRLQAALVCVLVEQHGHFGDHRVVLSGIAMY